MKKLSELIANTSDVEIITLMVDSREKVEAGMFFCLKGLLHDGVVDCRNDPDDP